jgi:hypothetical protein
MLAVEMAAKSWCLRDPGRAGAAAPLPFPKKGLLLLLLLPADAVRKLAAKTTVKTTNAQKWTRLEREEMDAPAVAAADRDDEDVKDDVLLLPRFRLNIYCTWGAPLSPCVD